LDAAVGTTLIEQLIARKPEHAPTRTLQALTETQLVKPRRIEDLVELCAQNTVDGMIAQDLDDFDGACLHFSIAMRPLFPEYDGEHILKACEAFTSALFAQSKLKDDRTRSTEEILHDERWEFVRASLLKMCEILDIPKAYAIETSDWFRYHGIKDDAYVKHLLEAHRVFLKRITGNDNWYRELAGLYLCAVALHDKHDPQAITRGREVMRTYFSIIFQARESSNQQN